MVHRPWLAWSLALAAAACGPAANPKPVADASVADTAQPDAGPQLCAPLDNTLRLQHIQMLATHNSYHVGKPTPLVKEWDYTHDPLPVQLDQQGVRGFELDLHHLGADKPIAVMHVRAFDDGATCPTLGACLQILKTWSDAHPCHHPLVVVLENKDEIEPSKLAEHLPQFDAEVLAVWPKERLVTPDEVRGGDPDLKTAIRARGWPTMAQSRGKLVLVLYEKEGAGAAYRKLHPKLQGAVAFVFGEPDDPDVAAVLRDDPTAADIAPFVQLGYLVRTFPKPTLSDGVAALASGAQLVSTDYPVPRAWAPGYALWLPGGGPSRCNPVAQLPNCSTVAVNAGQ